MLLMLNLLSTAIKDELSQDLISFALLRGQGNALAKR